ncbi:MAG: type II toxin-antitoxin system PemK/MazF family toxin [Candidatus Ventricola sp.]
MVSNSYFNQSGKAIVCPIVKRAAAGPLHIELRDSEAEGIALCEQVRYLDLAARRLSKLTATHYSDLMDMADTVAASMFEVL